MPIPGQGIRATGMRTCSHFTVQANGHVREAEAVSAAGTDLEIAACAKRVVSEWVFAKHTGRDIAAQRTYRFQ